MGFGPTSLEVSENADVKGGGGPQPSGDRFQTPVDTAARREGFKNWPKFADVLYGWPLIITDYSTVMSQHTSNSKQIQYS